MANCYEVEDDIHYVGSRTTRVVLTVAEQLVGSGINHSVKYKTNSYARKKQVMNCSSSMIHISPVWLSSLLPVLVCTCSLM